jgi:hypothetical protein
MSALIHGLPLLTRRANNSPMRANTHSYGWDEEPADERPSEFMESTGYSLLTGCHVPSGLSARHARRRGGQGPGIKTIVFACIAIIGASGLAIHEIGKLLHS